MTVTLTLTAADGATTQITLPAPTTVNPTPGICTLLSQACAVSQNSGIQNSTTHLYPLGLPTSYDWYGGNKSAVGWSSPPSGFTSITGWGQIYPQDGFPNPACNVFLNGWNTYVHKIAGGWTLVQPDTYGLLGGHYAADFHSYPTIALPKTKQADGSWMIESPPNGYNDHFYPDSRGLYTDGTVNGAFTVIQMRTDNPNANLIANMGVDWWLSTSAPYVSPEVNSPGLGMSSWVKLTTDYQYFYYTNLTAAQLASDPPPPLVGRP